MLTKAFLIFIFQRMRFAPQEVYLSLFYVPKRERKQEAVGNQFHCLENSSLRWFLYFDFSLIAYLGYRK